MKSGGDHNRVSKVRTALDVAIILVLALVMEAGHFSWRDGRPIGAGDCVQYVDAAEAFLTPDKSPNLALRKPGYPLILAGTALAAGNMSWAAIAVNHLFQALLPLAAYGLGRNLRSRLAGWLAAVLVIAQLQAHPFGDRLMSEAAYMCFLSFGGLALAAGLTRRRLMWLLVAGLLLSCAWLIRSVAVVVIGAALLCTVWVMRDRARRAVAGCVCLALPALAGVMFECSLNLAYCGQFRTSTGSLGLMLVMRTCYLQGLPMPNTETGRRCLALLPERDPEEAYRTLELDTWVARYHAVHDHGMDDWQTDALMKRAAWEMMTEHPRAFVSRSFNVFVRHLLRQSDGPLYSRLPPLKERAKVVVHPAGVNDPDPWTDWYVYWGLPHRTLEESLDLASRTETAAAQRAPFAQSEPFPTLRYWSMRTPVADVLGVFRDVASLWPGFALILCGVLGLNRRTCAFFAIAYVLEAVLIAFACPSEFACRRYLCVWLATDAALTAALVTTVLSLAAAQLKATRTSSRPVDDSVAETSK